MADDSNQPLVSGEPVAADAKKETVKKKQQRGLFSRIWNGVFRVRGDDFEKRLQYISKEEAIVVARMKKRSQSWRSTARNLIILSVTLEVIAVGYAIMTTRSLDLNWKMRALRVLPMFLLPGLSSAIYTALMSFTKMCDRKDQKSLERLRAERQAKIDELKERTNYYTTQQLIQRYDPDPAAKAAAASVLASKLGADSGLKVYVGEESKLNQSSGKSNDSEYAQSQGLRNRKRSHNRSSSTGSLVVPQTIEEMSGDFGPDDVEVLQNQTVVEHHPKSTVHDGGWIARIAALLVGEDPTQSYALICGSCHMHNGLARKEDFPYITYYCPHCHALNKSRNVEEPPVPSSTSVSPVSPSDDGAGDRFTEGKLSGDNATAAAESTGCEDKVSEEPVNERQVVT